MEHLLSGDTVRRGHTAFTRGILRDSKVEVVSAGTDFYNANKFPHIAFLYAFCDYLKSKRKRPATFERRAVRDVWRQARRELKGKNKIVIAATPEKVDKEYFSVLDGGILHEAFHSMYTHIGTHLDVDRITEMLQRVYDSDVPYEAKPQLLKDFLNIYEDSFIERQGMVDFGGAVYSLSKVHQMIWDRESRSRRMDVGSKVWDAEKQTYRHAFKMVDHVVCYLRDRIQPYLEGAPLDEYHPNARYVVDYHMADLVERGQNSKDTYECFELALETINILSKLSQQNEENDGDGDESEDQQQEQNEEQGDDQQQNSSQCQGDQDQDQDQSGSDNNEDEGDGSEDGQEGQKGDDGENQDSSGSQGDGDEDENSGDQNSSGSDDNTDDNTDGDSDGDSDGAGDGNGEEGEEDSSKGSQDGGEDEDDHKGGSNSSDSKGDGEGTSDDSGGDTGGDDIEEPTDFDSLAKELENATEADGGSNLEDIINEKWKDLDTGRQKLPQTDRPLTREYDRIHHIEGGSMEKFREMTARVRKDSLYMRSKLMAYLRGEKKIRRHHRLERGRQLSSRSVHEVVYSKKPRPFQNRTKKETENAAVSIVIDESGSMDSEQDRARYMLATFAVSLQQLKVPFEIIGFRAGACIENRYKREYGTEKSREWNNFTRTSYTNFDVFRTFDEPFTNKALKKLMKTKAQGFTPLLAGYDFAARRLVQRSEPRRIIIVITDGQPTTSGGRFNSGDHVEICNNESKLLEKMGVETLFVGYGEYCEDSIRHFRNHVYVPDLPSFSKRMNEYLMQALRKPSLTRA